MNATENELSRGEAQASTESTTKTSLPVQQTDLVERLRRSLDPFWSHTKDDVILEAMHSLKEVASLRSEIETLKRELAALDAKRIAEDIARLDRIEEEGRQTFNDPRVSIRDIAAIQQAAQEFGVPLTAAYHRARALRLLSYQSEPSDRASGELRFPDEPQAKEGDIKSPFPSSEAVTEARHEV